MKFGKKLETLMIDQWRYSYVDYKRLKKLLKLTLNESEFLVVLQDEIGKVNGRVQVEEKNLLTLSQNLSTARRSNSHEITYERSRAFYSALEALVNFSEVNYTIVYKITKKFDKQSGLCISPRVLAAAENEPFMARLSGDSAKDKSNTIAVEHETMVSNNASFDLPPLVSIAVEEFEALVVKVSAYAESCQHDMIFGEDGDLSFELENNKTNLSMLITDIKRELRTTLSQLFIDMVKQKGAGAIPVASIQEGTHNAIAKARSSLFSGLVREVVHNIALVSPEGVVGLEHILKLQEICFYGAHTSVKHGEEGKNEGEEKDIEEKRRRRRRRGSEAIDERLSDTIIGSKLPSSSSTVNTPPASNSVMFSSLFLFLNNCINALTPHSVLWMPSYRLKSYFPRDVLAGVTIGVMLVPQGLAYAGLAGLPAFRGLYTAFPPALYTLFGTSRHAAIGPQSIPALLIAQGLGESVGTGVNYERAVASVTFFVGAICLLAGWLHLGFVIRFISKPVLAGFAGGSAVLTIINCLNDALGVNIPRSSNFFIIMRDLASALPHSQWPCFLTTVFAFLLLLILPKAPWSSTVPPPLQVTVLSIVIFATYMKIAGISGEIETNTGSDIFISYRGPGNIPLVGSIVQTLPQFTLPWPIPLDQIPLILQTASAVSLVGFIESAAVTQTYGQQFGYSCNPSTELKALGAVNIIGGSLGTLPVMAAFGRSGVNVAAGVATPFAQAISAVVVALIIIVASPALYFLPLPVLSAIIIKAVLGLIDIPLAKKLLAGDKKDAACLAAAFLATVSLGVLYGVLTSVAISLVLFVSSAVRTTINTLGRVRGTASYAPLVKDSSSKVIRLVAPLRTCCALRFEGPLWFANVGLLKDAVLEALSSNASAPPRLRWSAVVLDCSAIAYVDSTAVLTLEECIIAAHENNIPLILASCPLGTLETLRRFDLITALGGESFVFIDVHSAVSALTSKTLSALDLPRRKEMERSLDTSRGGWRQYISNICLQCFTWRNTPDSRKTFPLLQLSRSQTSVEMSPLSTP
jgi:sulfate permease, SulP family